MSLQRHLFSVANARILGVARIGVGVAALMELVPSSGRLLTLAEPGTLRLPILEPIATAYIAAAPLVIGLWLVAGVAFTIGFLTPIAGAVLSLVVLGLVTADQQLFSNHAYLIAIAAGLLTAGGAGTSLSLDVRRRGTGGDAVPAWAIYAIRLQVSIVYLFSALSKLNPSFLSGSVVAASLRRDGIAFPEAWIGFESMFVLSVVVVVAELFLAIGLWRRRWRPLAFVIGLFLHVGIVATMHNAWDLAVFTILTLSLYVAFLPAPRGGHAVVWDDACGFCGIWVRWFRRLDWLDTLRFVPRSRLAASNLPVTEEAAVEALHVVGPRRTSRAFRAVTGVASVLPVSFLWAPILRVPPIAMLGEHVYRMVATRRLCALPLSHAAGVSGSAKA